MCKVKVRAKCYRNAIEHKYQLAIKIELKERHREKETQGREENAIFLCAYICIKT